MIISWYQSVNHTYSDFWNVQSTICQDTKAVVIPKERMKAIYSNQRSELYENVNNVWKSETSTRLYITSICESHFTESTFFASVVCRRLMKRADPWQGAMWGNEVVMAIDSIAGLLKVLYYWKNSQSWSCAEECCTWLLVIPLIVLALPRAYLCMALKALHNNFGYLDIGYI